MWRISVVNPNGVKVLVSSDFRYKLIKNWKEMMHETLTDNEKNDLLMQAFNGMTLFDTYKGVSKQ